MTYLKNRPQHLMLLLALVRRVLGVFHLVVEFQERVFYVVEARRGGFAGARGADGGHFGGFVRGGLVRTRWIRVSWLGFG